MAELQLLFLDTFSHDVLDGVNVDIVQFAQAVCIAEVRIIPLGSKIELNPGGTRLGATNPTQFHAEAFINDLQLTKAATFKKLGSIEYFDKNIQMIMSELAPTDCLIIKGWYKAVTISVYGYIADPGPPPAVPKIADISVAKKEVPIAPLTAPLVPPVNSKGDVPSEPVPVDTTKVTPPVSDGHTTEGHDMYSDSEEDVLAGDIITTDETGYDEGYEGFSEINTFNPYQFEANQLNVLFSPSLTDFAFEKLKIEDRERVDESAERILEIIQTFTDQPHHSNWVESLEEMMTLLPTGLASLSSMSDSYESVCETLVSWTMESLNEQAAAIQPEVPFKIRHLKTGLRFTSRMFTLSNDLSIRLLNAGVQEALFALFDVPLMALSLRLMVIQALNSLTHLPVGIQWFLEQEVKGRTAYQRLLEIATTKQTTRVVAAITPLLRKIHVYEALTTLQEAANRVGEKSLSYMLPEGEDGKSGQRSDYMETAEQLDDNDCDIIITALEEILQVIKHAPLIIAQPAVSAMPLEKQFQARHPPSDPYPGLYQMFSSKKLLEIIYVLLSAPVTGTYALIFTAVRDVLHQLMKTMSGMLYISSNTETTNGLIRLLLQTGDYEKDHDTEDNSAQTLGLQLVYHLQSIQFVDQLKEILPADCQDHPDVLSILQAMSSLTITPLGKEALVKVLSWDLDPLLALVAPTGDADLDAKHKQSTATKYFSDLLQMTLMYCEDLCTIEPFLSRLREITADEEFQKIMVGVCEWLEPCKDIQRFDHSCVPMLTKMFLSYVEQMPKIEVGLITCLRIMHHIAIPPSTSEVCGSFVPSQLCYQYALLELYSKDCLAGWIKILDKLSDKHLHSWQRGASMNSTDRDLLLFIIQPTLSLTKVILSQLIEVTGVKYQDTSSFTALFRTFTVICSVPIGGIYSDAVMEVQKDIVEILAACTQPIITGSEAEVNDAMSTSLWTTMIRSLLEFTISLPCNYLGGILLLSELLPLPLPVQCREELAEFEVRMMVNARTLWSAHLLPVSDMLEKVISTLAGTSCLHLQQVFRRVCWQLADLTSHFAQFISRCLLSTFVDKLEGITSPAESMEAPTTLESNVISTNMAATLSYISQQAPTKAALLHFLRIKSDSDCDYDKLFQKLIITLNTVCEKPVHNQCQEHIVTMLQSLCDVMLSLCELGEGQNIEIQLANELPDPQSLTTILASFMEHIGNYDHCYTSILQSLRTLVMLAYYDYTFSYMKTALLTDTKSLYNLFTRINNTFSKDSSDCISTLSTALDLLKLLVTSEEMQNLRTQTVSPAELSLILNWSAQPHPLDDLEKLLVDLREESLDEIVTNITSIIEHLKSDESKPAADTEEPETKMESITLPELPTPISIQDQFDKRSVYVLTEPEEEKLCSNNWLTNLIADDSDAEEQDDRVTLDLVEMCEKYLKDFNIESELKKREAGLEHSTKVAVIHHRKNEVLAVGQQGRAWEAPMRGLGVMRRGRGFARGHDPFRNRVPNTNRPPSLHVDDFVKRESNPQADEATSDRSMLPPRERGRGGYDRGRGSRQRYQTTPDAFKPSTYLRGSIRGGRGVRGGTNSPGRGYSPNFYGGGRGSYPEGREPPSRFQGRGGMTMPGGIRPDRRTFSPSSRYGQPPSGDSRRYPPMGDSARGGRGGIYGRDYHIMPPPRDGRDRPAHYRSYTK